MVAPIVFAVVMPTTDRGAGRNYLRSTLDNLDRGGLRTSAAVHSFSLVPSKLSDARFAFDSIGFLGGWPKVRISTPRCDRTAGGNAAAALLEGADAGAPWVLFVEDDIDVCADFFDAIALWLSRNAVLGCPLYAFGCSYPNLQDVVSASGELWPYPVRGFFGTQAIVVPAGIARSIARWLRDHPTDFNPEGACYDLDIQRWAIANGIELFAASAPSFAQHVGKQSVINPRAEVHEFPSWPGRDWSYIQARTQVREGVA